ncbi:TPA: O141 family O-antigen flippase, partial [Escherichia coli]|nr:O141 family O-antigen flippase [Escherichia coli]
MSKLKSNLVYLTFAQAISYIFPLLTLPYLSHKLDPSDFGMLGVCQAIVQYFIIVTDYGFNITTTKEISINRNNKKKISKIFSTTLLAKIFLLFVSAIGLIISGWAVKSISGYELLLICCFVGVIGNTFYPLWLFQGTETMKIPVIMSSGAKLLLLLSIFIFVKDRADLNIAALLLNSGNFFAGILGLIYIKTRKLVFWYRPTLQEVYIVLLEGWPVFISTVAISFYTTFNTVLLSYKVSSAEVGFYNAADKIRIAIQSMFGPITQAFYPRIVHLYKVEREAAINLLNKGMLLILGLTIPSALLFFNCSDYIVAHYLSSSFSQTASYLKLLSFLPIIIGIATVYCNWGLLGDGYGKVVSKIYVSFGLIHFLYATPLIIIFKVNGLILSVYITQTLITLT